jgi:hypothetical protein
MGLSASSQSRPLYVVYQVLQICHRQTYSQAFLFTHARVLSTGLSCSFVYGEYLALIESRVPSSVLTPVFECKVHSNYIHVSPHGVST